MTTDAGLSVRDLRDGLQRRLERSGLLDRLRAQLRAHLVAEIRTACAGAAPRTCAAPSGTARALNVVVAEFLARHEHDYARSVFLSESGTDPDAFAADELERLLSLPPKTIVDTDDHSILEHIVQRIVLKSDLRTCSVQTEGRGDDTIEQRLRELNDKFAQARDGHDDRTFDERLWARIREVESAADQRIKQEVERIRATELAAVRLAESERYRDELNSARDGFERRYQERLASLRAREQEQEQKLRERQQIMEAQEYQRRQQLLAEIEAVRLREVDLQRSIELDRRALQIERERLTDQLKDAERRADLMEREFKQRDHQLETRAAEYGRSFEAMHADDRTRLETALMQCAEQRRIADAQVDAFQECREKLAQAEAALRQVDADRVAFADTKENMSQLKDRIGHLEGEVRTRDEQILALKREIGERDGRITALDEERRTLASKVALAGKERAAIEARSASVETGWRHRYEELQAQVRSLAEELEWRIEDGEQARRDLEEEQLRCKALERDVDELTADLQRTRVQTVRQVPVPKITPLSCSTRLELARERLEHTLFEGRQYRPAPVELGSGGEESHPELMHTRAPVPTTPAIDSVVNRLPSAATPRRDNKAETQATTPTVIPAAASPAIVAQARETVPEESRQTTTTRNEPAMASSSMPEETQPAERVDDKAVDDVEKVPVKPELKSAANDADDEPVTKEGTTDLEVLAAMTGVVEQASAPARWPDMTNDVDIAIQQQQEEVVDEQKREAERRRQEMIEKQREERVLRAAQQRRERDERDRQMRAASAPARRQQPQRQQPQRPSASASVNLAPPERRKLAVAEQDAAGTEQKIDTEPDDPLEEYKRRVMERMRQQQGADQHQSQTLPLPPESDDELAFSGPDEHDEP